MSQHPTDPPSPDLPPPSQADATQPLPPAGPPPPPPPPPRRGRGRFTAGVVATALVVGGAAGFGGAALFSAVDDDAEPGGTGTSQVVDAGNDQPAPEGSVQAVADAVMPSVVRLDVAGEQGQASGSGIVLSEDGEILTNEHVVGVAGENGEIKVRFSDGTRADASVTGTDPLTDTALIQAEDVDGLTPITIGKSSNLDTGHQVVAIGSPYGLDSTVTTGIVSALDRPVNVGRDAEGNSTTYPAIQTDAAINPGNSGGALVDMKGRLVGINSSIRTAGGSVTGGAGSIGLGFAIPIDEVQPIIKQMRDGEEPTHARLGITVSTAGLPQQQEDGGPGEAPEDPFGQGNPFDEDGPDTPDLGVVVAEGAEVQEVTEGSTASQAGLEPGDVITGVDDKQITSADSLVAVIRSYRPGDEVEVTYERDGEEETTTLTLDSDADD